MKKDLPFGVKLLLAIIAGTILGFLLSLGLPADARGSHSIRGSLGFGGYHTTAFSVHIRAARIPKHPKWDTGKKAGTKVKLPHKPKHTFDINCSCFISH